MNHPPVRARCGASCNAPLRGKLFLIHVLTLCFLAICAIAGAQAPPPIGTFTRTATNPPIGIDTTLLMTDGSILCHRGNTPNWCKLTPNSAGSYINGTWTTVANMPVIGGVQYQPLYYASAVLASGQVMIVGGEYNGAGAVWSNLAASYNPVTNTWTARTEPGFGAGNIGDAQCVVLADGRFMLANITNGSYAFMDPNTFVWGPIFDGFTRGKADRNDEEGWTLLPNGKVLTVDVTSTVNNSRNSELYDPVTNFWTSAGDTLVKLRDTDSQEIGAGVLRQNGTVFYIGARPAVGSPAHTSIYNYLTNSWTIGPDFTGTLNAPDAPACLLPNGNVLCCVGPSPDANIFSVNAAHASFYEFDGTNLLLAPNTPNGPNKYPFQFRMLDLPNGQVMVTDGSQDVEIYTPSGTFDNAWRPTISTAPLNLVAGTANYNISGTQFNGLSQTAYYGDDATQATNYPLVRITSLANGRITYCRTHNHSSMGVATGGAVVSTQFDVPTNDSSGVALPAGQYNLEVVANGIPSLPRLLTVGALAPTAIGQVVNVNHNTAKGITLTGSDPNTPAQSLTFAISTNPVHGTLSGFNAATGAVTYTPNAGYNGSDVFSFTVTNTSGLTSGPANVQLNVAPDVPVANPQTVNTNQDTPVGITLTGNDGDDNPARSLTYIVTTGPAHGMLSGTAPNLTYTPNAGYTGVDTFQFKVNNGVFDSPVATVTINVNATLINVSGTVSVSRSAFLVNRLTGQYYQIITLTNNGGSTVNGPISLILNSLTNATCANATGTTSALLPAGRPYINAPAASLAPGASTSFQVFFNKTGPTITYSTEVWAGPGSR